MNYEKLYKEALERAKIFKSPYCQHAAEVIFPELKESEDERIRKELIRFFSKGAEYDSSTNGIKDRNIIAWLEKQGEQKYAWSEEDEEMRLDTIKAFQLAYPYATEEENPRKRNIDWLKSLKPNHWKPSKEQMNELRKVAFQFGNSCLSPYSDKNKELVSLYNDLKKL